MLKKNPNKTKNCPSNIIDVEAEGQFLRPRFCTLSLVAKKYLENLSLKSFGLTIMSFFFLLNMRNFCVILDLSYHFSRSTINEGRVTLVYCPTDEMVADMTKAAKLKKFETAIFGV